ncbi:N-acetylglucosamine-6-phosphate deacetylase [Solibacillus sp. FSL H8-0538]|uniref:N-acetylglucosamine-6-phosphate deacetylase n=1 Tax=Solibacillus sp. FSL H8-0538 TaxID=2921400 RepID=UPI0030F90E46
MSTLLLKNIVVGNAFQAALRQDVYIEDGKISECGHQLQRLAHMEIDFSDKELLAVPGFIDIHIHGANGHDVMDSTQEALHGMAKVLPQEGTTSFLATTMTHSPNAIGEALKAVAKFEQEIGEASLLGVHLEGPFVSPKRAGAQPIEHIQLPSIQLMEAWQHQSGNKILVTTIAPEQEGGLEFTKHFSKQGVIISLGHTDATYEQMNVAIKAGAKQVTHLYNQMSPLHHRDVHAIGAALIEDALTTELIVDRIHSSEQAVQLAYRCKGASRIILITDAIRAKGLLAGDYELVGQKVIVKDNAARLETGVLAGSIVTMEQAAKNMRTITNCSEQELIQMTSYNAAKQLNFASKGVLAQGYDADMTIVNEAWDVVMTICGGVIAYNRMP